MSSTAVASSGGARRCRDDSRLCSGRVGLTCASARLKITRRVTRRSPAGDPLRCGWSWAGACAPLSHRQAPLRWLSPTTTGRLWGTSVDGVTVVAPTAGGSSLRQRRPLRGHGLEPRPCVRRHGEATPPVRMPRGDLVDPAGLGPGGGRSAAALCGGAAERRSGGGRPRWCTRPPCGPTAPRLDEFVRQTRWRLSGDFADLADPAPDQYFPADLLTLRPGEVFVDCGAFDGDTLREVAARCPEFGSVDAFEPDAGNFAILQRRVATLTRGAAVAFAFIGRPRTPSAVRTAVRRRRSFRSFRRGAGRSSRRGWGRTGRERVLRTSGRCPRRRARDVHQDGR